MTYELYLAKKFCFNALFLLRYHKDKPVYAVAGGYVKRLGSSGSNWGYYVVIEHEVNGYTFTATYEHLQNSGRPSSTGIWVNAGQQIGRIYDINEVGEDDHLHLSIHPGQYRASDTSTTPRSSAGAAHFTKFPSDFINAGHPDLYW